MSFVTNRETTLWNAGIPSGSCGLCVATFGDAVTNREQTGGNNSETEEIV